MNVVSIASLAAVVVPLVFAPPAAADEEYCYPDTYIVIPLASYYIDIRGFFCPGFDLCNYDVWIYQEAGGNQTWLDRGDTHNAAGLPHDEGWCGAGLLPPLVDELIF